jgi:hypothetical protein
VHCRVTAELAPGIVIGMRGARILPVRQDNTAVNGFEFLHRDGEKPIKGWVRGVPLEAQAHAAMRNIAACPSSVRGSR